MLSPAGRFYVPKSRDHSDHGKLLAGSAQLVRAWRWAGLILKRAKVSRPSGHWGDDDYDVICEGAVVGPGFLSQAAPQMHA
jgi:hypothetical protein